VAFTAAGSGSGDTQPPTTPTNLAATASSPTAIELTWTASTDNVGVAGYYVYRCQGAGCTPSARVATVPATVTSSSDTGLAASTSYRYAVAAFDAAGNVSAASASATATTSATGDAGAPPALEMFQQNYAVPQSPMTAVSVPYSKAQQAGDLNIVVVGWNGATETIQSVVDTNQNTYSVAAPVVRSPHFSQAIYFAPHVASGSSTVTVTFSSAASSPDVRIVEYSGASATVSLLQSASANGTGAASAGPVATDGAGEFVFAAGTTLEQFTGAGAGFTLRTITQPDGDIIEDMFPPQPGSYVATAIGGQPEWVMQVVSFH
jgi:hypothetical protein